MCIPNTELQFCTCVEGNIFDIKDIYIWTLRTFVGLKESDRRGKIMIPVENLGNGITIENVIARLNTGNIFDFEYIPKERDTLHISFNAKNKSDYKYFSLIYINKIWEQGSNPVFTSISNQIAEGEIIIKEKKIYDHPNLKK
ncbi:hypothetical protein SAMN05421841_2357 [Chryseobacterium wanjuense]|uniref:Uncharacterized protein n=1 Tax=Chryseobacterium wanjuense TaxID=356305 RepID=A0A1I0QZD1_9FLAO|nr:hypothetical protein [Chryseobacterium wanjuense]SEW33031.1 hypothetical protein SAMN05421841_2357 [Chryseobacterium wanjuense]